MTDDHAFTLVKEQFPSSYSVEIKQKVRTMKAVAKLKGKPVLNTLKDCLRLTSKRADQIIFMAAHYCLKTEQPCIH